MSLFIANDLEPHTLSLLDISNVLVCFFQEPIKKKIMVNLKLTGR